MDLKKVRTKRDWLPNLFGYKNGCDDSRLSMVLHSGGDSWNQSHLLCFWYIFILRYLTTFLILILHNASITGKTCFGEESFWNGGRAKGMMFLFSIQAWLIILEYIDNVISKVTKVIRYPIAITYLLSYSVIHAGYRTNSRNVCFFPSELFKVL